MLEDMNKINLVSLESFASPPIVDKCLHSSSYFLVISNFKQKLFD